MKTAKQLLKSGADANALATYGSAFHTACRAGRLALVELFAQQGADVNQLTRKEGFSGLMMAAENGRLEVAKRLIELKADASVRAIAGEKLGQSALDLAKLRQHGAVAEFLSKLPSAAPEKAAPAAATAAATTDSKDASAGSKCAVCTKAVQANERVLLYSNCYHSQCFRCSQCK